MLLVFLRLGLTSFGGPIAHLGYFREEFVKKKKWISEQAYVDLVALCQFLPGPASSQVGMAIGLSRAGIGGALCAWLGFTLPSALMMVAFALGLAHFAPDLNAGWLHGLKIVAVAVVAQAIWGMGQKLCTDVARKTIALGAALIILSFTSGLTQMGVLVFAAMIGALCLQAPTALPHIPLKATSKKTAGWFLFIFVLLLTTLPLLRQVVPDHLIEEADSFFRAGSLVFGGGHVVLPLLKTAVVDTGWVSEELFTAGYGLAQAVPGPIFSFTAYLGAVSRFTPHQWTGALICLVAAFLPSFLLVVGVWPFWEQIRARPRVRQAMEGLNAAVVGLLMAAFCDPVWTSAIFSAKDFAFASIYFLLMEKWKFPSWSIVIASVTMGFFFG